MKEKGTIPEEVRKAFNISENITLDELITQMGQLYGITKKGKHHLI
jgi:bifunctional DNA-binding transcriptional regulator/antitoxin component of YhaV-PrlF toxin-antitoxin module